MHNKAIEITIKLGYTDLEIQSMTWNQVFENLFNLDFKYCFDCGYWLNSDHFEAKSNYCDECVT